MAIRVHRSYHLHMAQPQKGGASVRWHASHTLWALGTTGQSAIIAQGDTAITMPKGTHQERLLYLLRAVADDLEKEISGTR